MTERYNNQEYCGLYCRTQDVLWGSRRQKPTSLYLEVEPVGTGHGCPYFQEASQCCDFQKPFSGQSDHLRVKPLMILN